MKRKTVLLSTAAAVVALGTALAFTAPGHAFGPKGQGYGNGPMMGSGPGNGPCTRAGKAGYGQGYGMRGHGKRGMGQGRGQGFNAPQLDKELTADAVKEFIEGRLAWRGNDRLKVGKVTEADDNKIIAEIVTVDDSLVWKVEVDRKTGQHRRVTK
ncbi:MAG: DUF5320 domain-containing protein [Rhodospirillales bacterium]|nr:DUF5320 domain-containing protein [Rhodospirillales bacterium]